MLPHRCRLPFVALLLTPWLCAQETASQSPSPTEDGENEKILRLSPFDVTADKDHGYAASSTLAGSRLNTELADLASAISVFNKQFLTDTGSLNTTEAIAYALNGGQEFTNLLGADGTRYNDVGVQIRGFVGASLTRNYFNWALSGDSYNTERIDIARGPNSILFGIGGPAGVVNTTTKRARFDQPISVVEGRVGSWDDYRSTIDVNRKLNDHLAVRLNGVWQDKKNWREFEMQKRNAGVLAVTFRPFKQTEIRAEAEYGKIEQVLNAPFPAGDAVSAWLTAGKPISATNGAAVVGAATNGNRAYVYDPFSGVGPVIWYGSRETSRAPTVTSNQLLTRPFSDESIMPPSVNLYGPGGSADFDYHNHTVFIEQHLGDLSVELAYNKQYEMRDVHTPLIYNVANLRGDANALLPNGQKNPNAGKFYVESNAAERVLERDIDEYRVTAAYDLDLSGHSPWLGKHRFAALGSHLYNYFYTDVLQEVNTTPAGNATYPLDITNANNLLNRRNYLDFTQSDDRFRAIHDPRKYPVNGVNGVTSGFRRRQPGSSATLNTVKSGMIAWQGVWLQNKLHVTAGYRWDDQTIQTSSGTPLPQDPITREYGERGLNAKPAGLYSGGTRTFGAVYHATQWLSFFYNNANNFVPQSNISIAGGLTGPREGKGQDAGVRFNLGQGKLMLSVNRYRTDEDNRVLNSTNDQALINAINKIWEALNRGSSFVDPNGRDTVSNSGQGWEVELVANPTPRWRLTANAAQTELAQSATYVQTGAYIEANRALWQQNAGMALVPPFTISGLPANPKIGDAINGVDRILTAIRASDGTIPLQHVKYSANLFTTYTFSSDPGMKWLDGVMIGGGANYRGKAVAGYSASHGGAPLYSDPYTLVNLVIGKTFKVGAKHSVRLQLNVNNVFDERDHVVLDASDSGVGFYRYQRPRAWSVTGTFNY